MGQQYSVCETQRCPHINPARDETPAHLTNIRFLSTSGAHDIIQRFHQHIDDTGNIGDKLLIGFKLLNVIQKQFVRLV